MLCGEKECTGCGVCKAVCNKHAISMVADTLGFLHPVIDKSNCVECGLCAKKCPEINPVKRELKNTCYLAWSTDNDIHYNSASGGVSFTLAHHIIKEGGFAVGCVWDKGFNAVLKVIDNIDELNKTIGSKYVQSYISEDTWQDIRQRLNNRERGIVFGLPCQIAAIKSYTNNNTNLLFCDILCHGGCSPTYHHEHLEYLKEKKKIDSITDVKYRGGYYNFCYTVWDNKKLRYLDGLYADTYYYSFVKHYLFHETCYKCQYANANRISDLTIGDFWGIDPDFISRKNKLNGTNLVLVHNKKGEELWSSVQDRLEVYVRDIKEAIKGNDTLSQPTKMPEERGIILNLIDELGFEKAIESSQGFLQSRKESRHNLLRLKIRNIIPKWIIKIVKKLK